MQSIGLLEHKDKFFYFFHSSCADVSSPARMLKAFFISRCQSAYPFPDSRPDCSCQWTNSPLTVLLPLPFSYLVQKEVRVGWRWCASSCWPEVTEALVTNWRANCWGLRISNNKARLLSFLSKADNAADFVAMQRKHVVQMLRDRMFVHVTCQHELTGLHSLPDTKKKKKHPPSRLGYYTHVHLCHE